MASKGSGDLRDYAFRRKDEKKVLVKGVKAHAKTNPALLPVENGVMKDIDGVIR